ncbi:DUF2382 domain-containing protein [Luteipulveratus mongoliensis]|uniref:Photosystem reaction center subunit H n=1 Tax=Luteipulveratus mongoliensis TaxID=571913 RepID=A0A0K1JDS0_9MICO|nr:PRC and DUF2382 domain-containing protein [Luteipulveratus mongoliensis]AKU14730.1 hypothetical protein VV02_00660 [Luteipulveratus mongoliensis]
MTIAQQDISRILDQPVQTSSGEKIGKAGQVYVDDRTGEPAWVTVNTGLFGSKQSFVPLAKARVDEGGLTVGYDKDRVKDAPQVDGEEHLSPQQEEQLYRHYRLEYGADDSAPAASGSATDDATRSEERLNVGTRRQERGRARLRKHVVTEQQHVSVPITREEVTVEREPITASDREAALPGHELSEEEREVVLYEDAPVVEKETVPVERVRLAKTQVTEQAQLSEEVRSEHIEVDRDPL